MSTAGKVVILATFTNCIITFSAHVHAVSGIDIQEGLSAVGINPAQTKVMFIDIANSAILIRDATDADWSIVDLNRLRLSAILNPNYFDSEFPHASTDAGPPPSVFLLARFSATAARIGRLVTGLVINDNSHVWASIVSENRCAAISFSGRSSLGGLVGRLRFEDGGAVRAIALPHVEESSARDPKFLEVAANSLIQRISEVDQVISIGSRGYVYAPTDNPAERRLQCMYLDNATSTWHCGALRELYTSAEFSVAVASTHDARYLLKVPATDILKARNWSLLIAEAAFAGELWKGLVRQHPSLLLMQR